MTHNKFDLYVDLIRPLKTFLIDDHIVVDSDDELQLQSAMAVDMKTKHLYQSQRIAEGPS